ncbi:hypothetical protein DL767_002147 [Monosporascus sp. MG133]|nr:hypothetical protein DL767_002147 [Monosporascus sp. MG133]
MPGARGIDLETSVERLICRLEMKFEGQSDTIYGTGFVVNIPQLPRLCVFTAAHNIRRTDKGKTSTALSIRVRFPRIDRHDNEARLEWTATNSGANKEYFVPDEWDETTLGCGDNNWLFDWGVILGPERDLPLWKDTLGFGFSIDPTVPSGLIHVHGFPENSDDLNGGELTNNLSNPDRILHNIETRKGMSGGPVWMKLSHGDSRLDTVVGIHNYAGKATRLNLEMIRRIFWWIGPHLRTTQDQPTRLGAVVESEEPSKLRLRKTTPAEKSGMGATAFLWEPGTKLDILPAHIGPKDGGLGHEKDYLYVLAPSRSWPPSSPTSPSSSSPISTPLSGSTNWILHLGGEHLTDRDAPRSVGFKKVLNKDSLFRMERKGKTSKFRIVSKDRRWILSLQKPESYEKIETLKCCRGEVTPILDTAKFVIAGGVYDAATAFLIMDQA